jgi:hypothetical protein
MDSIFFEINQIKTYEIKNMSPQSTVRDFKTELGRIDSLKLIVNSLTLTYRPVSNKNQSVKLEDQKTLESYGIKRGSKIEGEKYFKKEHELLLGIKLSTSDDVFCGGYEGAYRAVMPCSHCADPNSLTNWILYLLDKDKTEFACPEKCNQKWDFKYVEKCCLLTQDEREYCETKLSQNSIKHSIRIRQCPECMTFLEREDVNDLKLECNICSVLYKKKFSFCCQCESEWPKGLDGKKVDVCGAAVCKNNDLETLAMCSYINLSLVPNVGAIPSIRACPKCGKLAEHTSQNCKKIICPNSKCEIEYCFVCLETSKICLSTSSAYDKCKLPVAPKQTVINRPS